MEVSVFEGMDRVAIGQAAQVYFRTVFQGLVDFRSAPLEKFPLLDRDFNGGVLKG